MKNLILIITLLFTLNSYAQTKRFFVDKKNGIIEYIETYRGGSYQTGYFKNNKRHGLWKMFDQNHNLIKSMMFEKGEKYWLYVKKPNKEILIYYVSYQEIPEKKKFKNRLVSN